MNEDLLQYVWKFQLFNHKNLELTNGEPVEIIKAGFHNHNSGPDFFNGQIQIAKTKWAGNIEIHFKSSQWFDHKHENDELYDKIILHVVWEENKKVVFSNGSRIPTLELKGRVSKSILEKYDSLKSLRTWVPCETNLHQINRLTKQQAVERALVERLEQKSNRIDQLLHLTKNDWEAVMYQLLAKYFGFKINATPFELLASSLSFSIVRKHHHKLNQLSALVYGQAGFLEKESGGSYFLELKKEYTFLKSKYSLNPLNYSMWKFMRMRPTNFPSIRLAQFISILNENQNLFQKIIETEKIGKIKDLFKVETSKYWETHYRFDIPASKRTKKTLGDSSIDVLLINVVVPLLFNYGNKIGDEELKEKALKFLQSLPAEKNSIVRKWKELSMETNTAYDSQGLLQLKSNYCQRKNCLNCTIGNSILRINHD